VEGIKTYEILVKRELKRPGGRDSRISGWHGNGLQKSGLESSGSEYDQKDGTGSALINIPVPRKHKTSWLAEDSCARIKQGCRERTFIYVDGRADG
jgi:hypothetical protein